MKWIVLLVISTPFTVSAQELDQRVRLKLAYRNHVDISSSSPYTDSTSLEAEYFRSLIPHIEIGVSTTTVFLAFGANLYAGTLTPALSHTVDRWHLYAGPSFGILGVHQSTGISQFHQNEFAIGFNGGADFTFTEAGSWFLNNSIRYLNSEYLRIFGLAVGIGTRF